MASMGVIPSICLTNHGEVEALGLLCARCGGVIILACTEVVTVKSSTNCLYMRKMTNVCLQEPELGMGTRNERVRSLRTEFEKIGLEDHAIEASMYSVRQRMLGR